MAAEVLQKLSTVDEESRCVTYFHLKNDNSVLKNNSLRIKLRNFEKLIIYNLQSPKPLMVL